MRSSCTHPRKSSQPAKDKEGEITDAPLEGQVIPKVEVEVGLSRLCQCWMKLSSSLGSALGKWDCKAGVSTLHSAEKDKEGGKIIPGGGVDQWEWEAMRSNKLKDSTTGNERIGEEGRRRVK